MKNIKEILEKLKDDEHYYGEYGRNFISNSDIRTLMTNPLEFKKPTPSAPHFLIGGYFHTAILEPDKIKVTVLPTTWCEITGTNTVAPLKLTASI